MNSIIKNIPQQTILSLAEQIDVQPGQVVSKTLVQNEAVSITLFAFDKDGEIGTHQSTGDALVTVIEGCGQFTVGGTPFKLNACQTIVMPAGIPHSIRAEEPFKWLLTVVFPVTTLEWQTMK